jgi:hypothetical protein
MNLQRTLIIREMRSRAVRRAWIGFAVGAVTAMSMAWGLARLGIIG